MKPQETSLRKISVIDISFKLYDLTLFIFPMNMGYNSCSNQIKHWNYVTGDQSIKANVFPFFDQRE